MKSVKLLALGLALAASVAQAQTTEVYGLFDVGILNTTNQGTLNGTATQISSGIDKTSRIGFRAGEDLGGGLKVSVNLEAGVSASDGGQLPLATSGAQNNLFSRASNLAVTSNTFGKITIGRQFNPINKVQSLGDTRAMSNFGSSALFWGDGSAFGGTTTAKTGFGTLTGTTFSSNTIRWDLPAIAGIEVTPYMVVGGQPGDIEYSSRRGIVATTAFGPLAVGGAFARGYGSTGANTSEVQSVNGNFNAGAFTVGAGWTQLSNPSTNVSNAANSMFVIQQLTVKYALSKEITLTGGQYTIDDRVTTANRAVVTALGLDYAASKRTVFYAAAGTVDNSGAFGVAVHSAGYANLNSLSTGSSTWPSVINGAAVDQTAVAFGIRHSF